MKIKKMICMLTCLAVIIAVTGCGSNNETSERNANDQSSVEDTLQAGMAREDNDINASLNYGYALILSAVNKEIIANGYITQIGIKHRNDFNDFNLSSDIMEPFRPLIDEIVYNSLPVVFDSEMRTKLLNIFNSTVTIDSNKYYLSSAISKFVSDVLKNLGNGTSEKVEFIRIQ